MDNLAYEDDHNNRRNAKDVSKKLYTFDDAITLCGTGKFHKMLFLICGLCVFTLMSSTLSVGFYIMFVKCDLDVSVYEQGLLASMAFMGIVVSSHTWGFLSDTWGRLKVIRISIFGSVILSILSAFSYTTWMLIVLRLFVGIFICGTQSSIYSYLGEFHGNKTRTRPITYLSTFLSGAMMIVPAFAIAILPLQFTWNLYGQPFSSWRLLEIVCTIPGMIASVGLPFLVESPKYLFTKGHHQRALDVLRTIYRINTGNPAHTFPVQEFSDSETSSKLKEVTGVRSALMLVWNQTIPMFERSRLCVTLNLLVHIFICYFVAHGVYMWLPEVITALVKHRDSAMTVCEVMHAEFEATANATGEFSGNLGCATTVDTLTYEMMIIMGATFTCVYFLVGYLIKAVGKKGLLISMLLLAGIPGIILTWTRNFYLNVVLFISFMVIGSCGGIISTISVEFYPTKISAMAMCLIMMIGRLGVVAGTNSVGLILSTNCDSIFYGLGSVLCALVLLSMLLPNDLSEKKASSNHS